MGVLVWDDGGIIRETRTSGPSVLEVAGVGLRG